MPEEKILGFRRGTIRFDVIICKVIQRKKKKEREGGREKAFQYGQSRPGEGKGNKTQSSMQLISYFLIVSSF